MPSSFPKLLHLELEFTLYAAFQGANYGDVIPMTDYRVIDNANAYKKSYFGVVFLRNERLKGNISLLKWIWLTIVELVVGAELLESIITTGSVLTHENIQKDDSLKYGVELHLTLHIPSGLITNLLRPHIIELLYYKFYSQYLILFPVDEPYKNEEQLTALGQGFAQERVSFIN